MKTSWLERHRDAVFESVIYLTLVLPVGMALVFMFVLFSTKPASPSTCASRPGISSGSTWWRYRYRNGVRCWYPGRRYARIHRSPRNKIIAEKSPAILSVRRFGTDQDSAEPEPRTVRVIQIYRRSNVHERIERAFDKLIVFPVEDEP